MTFASRPHSRRRANPSRPDGPSKISPADRETHLRPRQTQQAALTGLRNLLALATSFGCRARRQLAQALGQVGGPRSFKDRRRSVAPGLPAEVLPNYPAPMAGLTPGESVVVPATRLVRAATRNHRARSPRNRPRGPRQHPFQPTLRQRQWLRLETTEAARCTAVETHVSAMYHCRASPPIARRP